MLEKLRRDKRGDVTDITIFLILVFTFAIIFFTFAFIVPEITSGLNTAGLNNTPEGANAIQELEEFGTETIQRGFFLFFVGMIISTFVSAFLVRTHPIFLFLYIFMLGITIFIGTYLSNAYDQLRSIEIFAATALSQGFINIVMENMVLILLSVGALSMVVVFSKFSTFFRQGGAQGRL